MLDVAIMIEGQDDLNWPRWHHEQPPISSLEAPSAVLRDIMWILPDHHGNGARLRAQDVRRAAPCTAYGRP
jgi:hypothetical protein